MLSDECAWQQKAEEALKNAADDCDSGEYIALLHLVRLKT